MRCQIATQGKAQYPSPLTRFVPDDQDVPGQIVRGLEEPREEVLFELAEPEQL